MHGETVKFKKLCWPFLGGFVQITPVGSILALIDIPFPFKITRTDTTRNSLSLSVRYIAHNSRGLLSDKGFKYLT